MIRNRYFDRLASFKISRGTSFGQMDKPSLASEKKKCKVFIVFRRGVCSRGYDASTSVNKLRISKIVCRCRISLKSESSHLLTKVLCVTDNQ